MRAARALIPVTLLAAVLLSGCNKAEPTGTGGTGGAATSAAPSANGVADLSATEILDKAKAALTAADSFRMKGDINTDGQKITIDVKIKKQDLIGTLSINGAQVEILRAEGAIYFKGGPEFWKSIEPTKGETIASLLNGRWAKAPAGNEGLSNFAKIADPQELLGAAGKFTKGETKNINGVDAIALKDSSDKGALYIATVGEPYPLRIEGPPGEGALDFSEFGANVDIKTPATGEFIDLSTLGAGA